MMRALLAVLALLPALVLGAAAPAQARPVTPGLCLVDTPARSLATTPATVTALQNPSVTCAALLGWSWKDIETADGVYDWSKVDAEIAIVKAQGKLYTLAFQAGVYTPSWVYAQDSGASFSTLAYGNGNIAACTAETIGNPLNATFQAKWEAFIAAAGARYGSDPSLMAVKVSGINMDTNEFILPYSTGETVNGCVHPNDTANWQAIGYTHAKIAAAYTAFLNATIAAFPGVPVAAMVGVTAFPPIDDTGAINPAYASFGGTDVPSIGYATLGAGFVLQTNSLTGAGRQMQPIYQAMLSHDTAWQFSQPVSNDATNGCAMYGGASPCPSNSVVMAAALANVAPSGTYVHPRYMEVFPADVNDTADFAGVWAPLLTWLQSPSIGQSASKAL